MKKEIAINDGIKKGGIIVLRGVTGSRGWGPAGLVGKPVLTEDLTKIRLPEKIGSELPFTTYFHEIEAAKLMVWDYDSQFIKGTTTLSMDTRPSFSEWTAAPQSIAQTAGSDVAKKRLG